MSRPIAVPLWALVTAAVLPAIAQAQTWTQRVSGTANDLNDAVFVSTSVAVGVGQSGTIVRSTDGGLTWATPASGTAQDLQAVAASGQNVVAVGRDNGAAFTVVRSTDGGATWAAPTSLPGVGPDRLEDVVFVTSSIVVAVGRGGFILRSTDAGDNWASIASGTVEDLFAVDVSGSALVAVGNDNGVVFTVVRSTDSGASWAAPTSLPGVGPDRLLDVVFVTSSTVVTVGRSGFILRSTDTGDNWSNIASGTAQDLEAVDARGTYLVAVGRDNGAAFTVVRSVDSGASWGAPASLPAVGPDRLQDVLFLDTTTVLTSGRAGFILGSVDQGNNWTQQNSTTAQDLNVIAFNGVSVTLVMGKAGTILRSADQVQAQTTPIPFHSKWILAALLLGLAAYSLQRRRV